VFEILGICKPGVYLRLNLHPKAVRLRTRREMHHKGMGCDEPFNIKGRIFVHLCFILLGELRLRKGILHKKLSHTETAIHLAIIQEWREEKILGFPV